MADIVNARDLRAGNAFIYKNNLYEVIENSFNKGDIYTERYSAGICLSSSVNVKNSYNARKNLWKHK